MTLCLGEIEVEVEVVAHSNLYILVVLVISTSCFLDCFKRSLDDSYNLDYRYFYRLSF